MKGFPSKCAVLKLDLLYDHQVCCLQACMCALFSPEILQAVAVKGLINSSTDCSFLPFKGRSHDNSNVAEYASSTRHQRASQLQVNLMNPPLHQQHEPARDTICTLPAVVPLSHPETINTHYLPQYPEPARDTTHYLPQYPEPARDTTHYLPQYPEPARDTIHYLPQYLRTSQRHYTLLAVVAQNQPETLYTTCCSSSEPARDTIHYLL